MFFLFGFFSFFLQAFLQHYIRLFPTMNIDYSAITKCLNESAFGFLQISLTSTISVLFPFCLSCLPCDGTLFECSCHILYNPCRNGLLSSLLFFLSTFSLELNFSFMSVSSFSTIFQDTEKQIPNQ